MTDELFFGPNPNRPDRPVSALDGVRITYHHDKHSDEWVVRVHHPKGMQSLGGFAGEIEAKVIAAALATVVSVADTTWSLKSTVGEKTETVEVPDLIEFDAMKDTTETAIDLFRDFIAW